VCDVKSLKKPNHALLSTHFLARYAFCRLSERMEPDASPQCGAVAFSSNACRLIADSVAKDAAFSASTIRFTRCFASPIVIEYGLSGTGLNRSDAILVRDAPSARSSPRIAPLRRRQRLPLPRRMRAVVARTSYGTLRNSTDGDTHPAPVSVCAVRCAHAPTDEELLEPTFGAARSAAFGPASPSTLPRRFRHVFELPVARSRVS